MAITERSVKNKRNSSGELTGRAGTVYDVNDQVQIRGKKQDLFPQGLPDKEGRLTA